MSDITETPDISNIHVIGIGRTGGAYVEALLRTGEIEDNLALEGATLSGLLIDIGEGDVQIPNDYARSLKTRLKERGIPADRYHYESFNLELPNIDNFSKSLGNVRKLYEADGGTGLISGLPDGFAIPATKGHTPRAIAKAAAAFSLYLDDKPLANALERFAENVKKCKNSSTVIVAFSLAGGTGSGIASDIARKLKAMDLGDAVKIVGVSQLSHSGDGEYENSVAQTLSLEDIDGFASGSPDDNPFPGGCFIVSSEHSWQRLTAYTSTGIRAVRQHFKQLVTNRFVSDSFMRWAVQDGSTHLQNVLSKKTEGKCLMFNVAKLSHPGVQVLPGEPRSRWDNVLQQWVSFVPKYSGLVDGYSTESIDTHIYCARYMDMDLVEEELKSLLALNLIEPQQKNYNSYQNEFFDELTAYANLIFSGVKKEDLSAYLAGTEKNSDITKDILQLEKV